MSAVPKPDLAAPVLEVEGLGVDIDTPRGPLRAVRDVSFQVKRGETLCIVGESGCDKSITSLAVMTLLPAAATRRASKLSLLGEDLLNASPRRVNALRGNRMAMIFQEPMTALNPAYTIGNQLITLRLNEELATDFAVVWPGIDGYENPFGVNFVAMRDRFMDGLAEAMDAVPGVRIAFEPKPYEPRGRILLGTTAEGMLLCRDVEARLSSAPVGRPPPGGPCALCAEPRNRARPHGERRPGLRLQLAALGGTPGDTSM